MLDRPPQLQGWNTSDEDEIALRRWRGRTEVTEIETLDPKHPVFSTFRVRSGSGGTYDVEIRSLDIAINSCGCIDHRVNGLGTCKHIEGVLEHFRQRDGAARREVSSVGSERAEVYLDRR